MFKVLNGMTTKKKMEYIWDYYKVHIIVAIVLILAGAYFVHDLMTKETSVFNLTMAGSTIQEKGRSDLEDELTAKVGNKEDREVANIDFFPVEIGKDGVKTISMLYRQKFFAETAAGEIDMVVFEKEEFLIFAQRGDFYDLSKLGVDEPGMINAGSEKVENGAYGIDVSNNSRLKDAGYDTENKVLAVLYNSGHKDKCASVIRWLMQK